MARSTRWLEGLRIAALVLSALVGGSLWAQSGEDGDVTLNSGTNIVINAYTTATAWNPTTGVLTVASVSALELPAASGVAAANRPLAANDLLLVYQAQGATITTTDAVSYGNISSYGSAGLYRFVRVASISGSNITVQDTGAACDLTNLFSGFNFSPPSGVGAPQVIRVPQYRNLTITGTNTRVRATPWNGSIGGVVAIHVGRTASSPVTDGTLTINSPASIDVTSQGFRGGVDPNVSGTDDGAVTFRTTSTGVGGGKGESIAGSETRYNAIDGAYGRGAPANGGGGGNGHNGGGGGGGNGGFDESSSAIQGGWVFDEPSLSLPDKHGCGVPNRSTTDYLNAFNLESNSNATSVPDGAGNNCRGGGRGGYTWSDSLTPNPTTTGPGNSAWGGNNRRQVGGLGGRPLDRTPGTETIPRFYFGGGGGAGDANNNGGTGFGWNGTGCGPATNFINGTAGGGLVFLIVNRIAGSGGAIRANANQAPNSCGVSGEGVAGAGAGGTIVLDAHQVVSGTTLTLQANGGAGGIQTHAANNEAEGGGGGGGGGVIATSAVVQSFSGITRTANGGTHGQTNAPANINLFPANGATSGATGEPSVTAPARNSTPYQCVRCEGGSCATGTTPVTNASFLARRQGDLLEVEFTTSVEAGNVGFYVEGDTALGPERLTGLVPSRVVDSERAQSYRLGLPDRGHQRFWLVDVDLNGRETRRGPFALGIEHGAKPVETAIDWPVAQAALTAHRQVQRAASAAQEAWLGVTTDGIQRIDYTALREAGVDLAGVPTRALAVVGPQGPVPRRVLGPAVFGPGAAVEFYGEASDSLYAAERTYVLRIAPEQAVAMPIDTRAADAGDVAMIERRRLRHAPDLRYGFSSPLPDPWFAERLLANPGPASTTVRLDAGDRPADVALDLAVGLWGGIDWPSGTAPDHHVRVYFDGSLVAERYADGLVPIDVRQTLTPTRVGVHEVRVEVTGQTGYAYDLVNLDAVELGYDAPPRARGGIWHGRQVRRAEAGKSSADGLGDPGTVAPPLGLPGFPVPGFADGPVLAYRIEQGRPTLLQAVSLASGGVVRVPDLGGVADYWIGREPLRPSVRPGVAPATIPTAPAEYLVITHPLFRAQAEAWRPWRAAQGLTTAVADVEAIYARYSAGNVDPEAIRAYIRDMARQAGTRYVLLLGGDTYDYRNRLGIGSVSHVPTFYTATGDVVRHAPSDALYADLNGDRLPDLAIGRLPVRTPAELDAVLDKIRAYESGSGREPSAFLVAGRDDPDLSFAFAADQAQQELQAWRRESAYVSQHGLELTRAALREAFGQGRSLIGYYGHSSPTQWSFDPLFRAVDVAGLALPTRPSLVVQWGCWNSYFVSPQAETLGHALLLTPNRGAAASFGASTLTNALNHERFGVHLMRAMQRDRRIGDVIRQAKIELRAAMGEEDIRDLILGGTLLGDPAMTIR